MAEEKKPEITMSQDDTHVLRILLHSIQGLSPVSVPVQSETTVYNSDERDS